MVRIADIANHVGVSVTTVSYVLNDSPDAERISLKTRQKILQAAEELGYRSNSLAKAMRTGNSKMMGVLGGRTEEEHVGRMLTGALEAADEHGYTLKLLRLHAIGNSAQQAIRRSSELRLMGILALHLPEEVLDELQAEAKKNGTPLVLMDTYCENPDIVQIVSDDDGSFNAGIEHLVKLGHSKIALLKGGGDTQIGISRRKSFEKALTRNGLKPGPQFVAEGSYHRRDPSLEAARTLLCRPVQERAHGYFCTSDLMALAALRVAHELDIDVPAQLSVIGFANMTAAEYAYPALTTIEQPFEEIGRSAVNTLRRILDERAQEPGEISPGAVNNVQVLPTRLVERDSTAAPAF